MLSTIIKTTVVGLLLAGAAIASAVNLPTTPATANPVIDVTPFNKEDELRVITFFKFGCPICRSYHLILEHWGRSLPSELKFQFYPIIEGNASSAISAESLEQFLIFWSMEQSGTRDQRSVFAESAYELVQDAKAENNAQAWITAIQSSGVNYKKYKSVWDKELANPSLRLDRLIHYQPNVVPSIVICGKWMISPDSTNGNQELFMQLANGLVSKCMIEKGIKFKGKK